MSLLVTGFGPFEEVVDNASGRIAERLGKPFRISEVAFSAWNELLEELAADPPECLLLLGVDPKGERLRLETVAHNKIGHRADVRGEIWGPGPLDPLGAPQLAATLWTPEALMESAIREVGADAGGYLCNFSFYRTLQAFPRSRVGFIHVPPLEEVSLEVQIEEVEHILRACGVPTA
jgi:pyrrolidone-carboxylate peptidase